MEPWRRFGKKLLVLSAVMVVTTTILAKVAEGLAGSEGTPVDGLQISVLPAQTADQSELRPAFTVELRNLGDHDLILNLGIMLANGRRQYADAITLLLGFPSGSKQRLVLMGPAFVAGRMDPLVVPLPVGASFSIPVDFTKFAPFGKDPLKLEPGTYVLQAQFQGKKAINPNLDMQGMALMPYWTGTVISNKLQFEIGMR